MNVQELMDYKIINKLIRKDVDVNEHVRLSNITLGHQFKNRNNL